MIKQAWIIPKIIFVETSKKERLFAVKEVKMIIKGIKAKSWNINIPIANSPKNVPSSPLSSIILATSEVEEDDKAIPIRNDSKSEKPKIKDKKTIKKIERVICKMPPIIINLFKEKILEKLSSKPMVNKRKIIPKYAKLLIVSTEKNLPKKLIKITPPKR